MIVTIYADASGNLYPRRDTDGAAFSAPPPNTSNVYTFSGDDNPNLATDLWANVIQYTVVNSVLLKNGVAVVVNPDGTAARAIAAAKSLYTDLTDLGRLFRSVAKSLLNEINLLRERLTAQDSAVANAISLADLKSRWATLATNQPMPDRTMVQVQSVVDNALDANT